VAQTQRVPPGPGVHGRKGQCFEQLPEFAERVSHQTRLRLELRAAPPPWPQALVVASTVSHPYARYSYLDDVQPQPLLARRRNLAPLQLGRQHRVQAVADGARAAHDGAC
jgi:hypothetical protein